MSDYIPVEMPNESKNQGSNLSASARKMIEVEKWLSERYDFRFNVVKGRPQFSEKGKNVFQNMKDDVLSTAWRGLNLHGHNVKKPYIKDIISSDFSISVNPIYDFILSTKLPRGHKDYISEVADTLVVSNWKKDRFNLFFKKLMVGMVANIFETQFCANHLCLVLAGDQGKGKSTWLHGLLPDELSSYFHQGAIDPDKPDHKFRTTSNIIVNLDDYFAVASKRKSDSLKAIITDPMVECRRPYAAYDEELAKICLFAATCNDDGFLHDATGSRRFFVLKLSSLDYGALKKIDRGAMFRQCYDIYKSGWQYWLTAEEQQEMENINKSFQVDSAEFELLSKYIRLPRKNEAGELITNTDLLTRVSAFTTSDIRLTSRKLGQALGKLGFSKGCYDSKNRRGVNLYRVVWLGEDKPWEKNDPNDDSGKEYKYKFRFSAKEMIHVEQLRVLLKKTEHRLVVERESAASVDCVVSSGVTYENLKKAMSNVSGGEMMADTLITFTHGTEKLPF